MQFKADATKIKRWREERHWSQEHLAELAGIGVRTVQRVEKGEPASRDSLMALAAAFNVDTMALVVDAQAEAQSAMEQERARVTAGGRLSLWIHLASYVLGMLIFAAISIGSGYFVMMWPTLWWTGGLAAHAVTVFIVEIVYRHDRRFSAAK